MRPADRLFEIVLMLGRGKVLTARTIAERLEVSERTIYRDINDLAASGVPIDGEAGVGYRMGRDYQVPPMMFDAQELQALSFGAQVARVHGDVELAEAAQRALAKVDAVLPAHLRRDLDNNSVFVPGPTAADPAAEQLGQVRRGINDRRRVFINYADGEGNVTERIVWPLSLAYWRTSWTLGGWCELRSSFRNFRIDRIEKVDVLMSEFPDQPGRRLADYIRAVDGSGTA